jgi:3-oxoacyl-[acyl-carrier-protein] synthase III
MDAAGGRRKGLTRSDWKAHAHVLFHDSQGKVASVARTQILGTGSYAPQKVITNHDLERIVDTTDAWITERTGIKERRQAAEGEYTSDLAVKASIPALEMARTRPEELDLIVVGTISPDMPMPSCAAFVQHKLGAKNAAAFDVSAACAGSLYALSVADQFIQTGRYRRILVVGAELLTRMLNWKDRNTCVLFGDGAGAMVLGPSDHPDRGVLATHLHTDGSATDILTIRGGGTRYPATQDTVRDALHTVAMNGREIYKFAVRALGDAIGEAIEKSGFNPDQVKHVIAHQANTRIIQSVMERVNLPLEKCFLNIQKYGNTSAASLPITLDEANRAGILKPGDLILMMAIGAGMAWGTSMVRW